MLLLSEQQKLMVIHRPGVTYSYVDLLFRFPIAHSTAHPSPFLHGSLSSHIVCSYSSDAQFSGHLQDLSDPSSAMWRDTNGLLWKDCLLCITISCQAVNIRLVHDKLGYPSFNPTLAYAPPHFFWRTLSCDLKSYCHTFYLCQTCKTDTANKPGSLQPISPPLCPFHTECVDFIEGLPMAPGGLNIIATITDKYTKAIRLLACKKSDTGMAFTHRFYRQVNPVRGVPTHTIIHCNSRFVSAFWTTPISLAGSTVAITTAYHPQADGHAERTNRTFESSVRILCLESDHVWLDLLPHVELANNTTPCYFTGFSPFSLLYSHPPHRFGDRALTVLDNIPTDAETLAAELRDWRALASNAITRAQAMQKCYFGERHSPFMFLPEDLAMLVYSGTLKGAHKLSPTGSVDQIIQAASPVIYQVRIPSSSHIHDVISVEPLQP